MSEGERRRKQREGPGWFATLGGAAVLIVLGFGVGLVAGAAWDEPELVIDHFSGRTTSVPVEDLSEPPLDTQPEPGSMGTRAQPASMDAQASAADTQASPAPLGSGVERPIRSARPQVAAPSPRAGRHAIQVGAFGEREAADSLARELGVAGYEVYVVEDTGGSARFKVRVGPVAERAEADRLAARLKKNHRLPTWVLTRDPR
ncbi:MAG: hypothetical protein GY723_07180 [bacterium]|nr:hypothetical protein [bacterium]MCP5069917.1 hypothetical protein [bacterium]